MPIPFILGAAAAIAGIAGVGSGISGAVKVKDAKDTISVAKNIQNRSVELYERRNKATTELMDSIGKQELEIIQSFKEFSQTIERIQNKPEFGNIDTRGEELPKYDPQELKKVAVEAEALAGALKGVGAAGTFGSLAASGAMTAVTALGTASTGAAISSLSGAAATNAALAALGGGSLAAGGGGMALGSAILGGATLGVGLLVGGIIFNATGSKLSDEADEAYHQAKKTESDVNKIVSYFDELDPAAKRFKDVLSNMQIKYRMHLYNLMDVIDKHHIPYSNYVYWDDLTEKDKLLTKNTILLVSILYDMCKVKLVKQSTQKDGINTVNHIEINRAINRANQAASA